MTDTPKDQCPECGYDLSDSDFTVHTEKRWKYTGSIIVSILLISLPLLITVTVLGFGSIAAITQGWLLLYSTVVLMAATWLFGKETLETVRHVRKNR